ncbi:MFS transporter [Candidatus Entotheonella palauensis]|nr:MFS transporter [Candidatus Entotheonella palauensis]
MTRPLGVPGQQAWGPFRAFANSGYLRLWIANFLSYTPRWMQMTLLAWLILELSDSPWLVALIGFFSSMPMLLLGLFGGVLADRLNRLRLLVVLQVVNTAVSLLMTGVLVTGTVEVWHGYVVVAVAGASWALGTPSRRALLIDLLGTSGITNAVALDSVGMNGSRMLGPALGGALIALIGVTGGFAVTTVSYALGLALLMTLRVKQAERSSQLPQSVVRNLAEGFRYAGQNRVIKADIYITVIMNFLLFPYMQMVPVLARDVLHVGPTLMGLLQSAEGVGALAGSITIASIATISYHGRYFVIGSTIALLALVGFSMSEWYIVSFPLLLLVGMGTACFGTMQSTIVMISAPDEMRGRALGVISLAIGAGPLGSLVLGAVADAVSPVFAVRTHALLGVILLSLTVLVIPAIMDRTETAWRAPSGSAT